MKILVPLESEGGKRIIADRFEYATYYIIFDVSSNKCRELDMLKPARTEGGRRLLIASWAMNRDVKAAVAKEIGRRAYDYLRIHGITLYYVDSSDPCEAARAVVKGKARVYPEELILEDTREERGMDFEGNLLR